MHLRALVILALASAGSMAQQTVAPAPTCTVSGHVYLADGNSAAYLAAVTLKRVPAKFEARPFAQDSTTPAILLDPAKPDGSFSATGIPPGTYYVIPGPHPGYLSPSSQLATGDLADAAPEEQQRIAAALPTVTVTANETANIDLVLPRAAGISGSVMFDDGRPFLAGAALVLMRRESDSKLHTVSVIPIPPGSTDRRGNFSFAGLTAGEYVLNVRMSDSEPACTGKAFQLEDAQIVTGQMLTLLPQRCAPAHESAHH